ncbi:MAG: hypothetical protein Pars2KO_10900 [Parasphingorhabdus sp.]
MLEDEEISEAAMREMVEDVKTLSELINTTVPLYDIAEPSQKEKIARIICSELLVSQNRLEYKVNKGFEFFKSDFVANGAPLASIYELLASRELIKSNINALKSLTL